MLNLSFSPCRKDLATFWLETPEPLAHQKQGTAQTCTILIIPESKESGQEQELRVETQSTALRCFNATGALLTICPMKDRRAMG